MTTQLVYIFALTPLAAALIIGLATDLEMLSNQAAEKTANWADDAVSAIDCAYQARPLTDCSPELFNYEYAQEIESTNEILERTQSTFETIQNADRTEG